MWECPHCLSGNQESAGLAATRTNQTSCLGVLEASAVIQAEEAAAALPRFRETSKLRPCCPPRAAERKAWRAIIAVVALIAVAAGAGEARTRPGTSSVSLLPEATRRLLRQPPLAAVHVEETGETSDSVCGYLSDKSEVRCALQELVVQIVG